MRKNEGHIHEIKLVGVNHGVSISGMFGNEMFEVAPPEDLFEQVGITSETLVGIEATAELSLYPTKYHEKDPNFISLHSDRFFRILCKRLLEGEIPRAFLDSHGYTRRMSPAAASRVDELKNKGYRNYGLSTEDMKEYGYKHSVLDMINLWREPLLYKNIAQMRPDVVVMGQAHADNLASSSELQSRYRLRIKDYIHVEPYLLGTSPYNQPSAPGFERYERILPSFIRRPSIQEVATLTTQHEDLSERQRRLYNSFTIGRVLNEDMPKPEYLGRFYITDSAESSLFEMTDLEYDSNGSFRAKVFDVVGDSVVEGMKDERSIRFKKTYTKVLGKEIVAEWLYLGNIDPETGMVTGRYGTDNDSATCGNCFVVTPFVCAKRRSPVDLLNDRRAWDSDLHDIFNVRSLKS